VAGDQPGGEGHAGIRRNRTGAGAGGHGDDARADVCVELLSEDSYWLYVGEGVRFGNAEAPVCCWKPKGSTMYRIIFGDLAVMATAPEHL